MATMAEIEKGAQRLAQAHAELGELAMQLNRDIMAAREQYMRQIKTAAATGKKQFEALFELVKQSRPLFESPRTQIFHGVKVGWQKGKGKIEIDDPDHTIELIMKHFPDQAADLIVTTAAPSKTELEKLSAADLKKIACRVAEDSDFVVVKHADSEVDKMVKALLKAEKE